MAKQPEPKFLADENVVKLGKWLRILGYDVASQFPASDAQLARLARREERILLTRDREFLELRIAEQCLLLKSQDTVEQLKRVLRTFGLTLDNSRLFTRCVACNVPLESIPKAEAKSFVPTDVYKTYDEFHRCSNCEKVFWKGSHTRNFQKWLEEIDE